MTESIPFWEDWRFWQIVVTGALAFVGFTFGTWVKDWFDRRRDEARHRHESTLRDEEKNVFAIAFRAELISIMSDAETRLHALKKFGEGSRPAAAAAAAQLGIPAKLVYDNNTDRLGGLGGRVAELVVAAHGTADHLRNNVAALAALPSNAAFGEGSLEAFRTDFRALIERGARAHNALDAFLGVPERFPDPKALAAKVDPAGDPAGAPAEPAESDPAQVP